MKSTPGGIIARIRPGSAAEVAGLRAGDAILSISGHILRDVIDYQFYGADTEVNLVVRRGAGEPLRIHIEREYGEDLGIEFTDITFDGIRRCRNHCEFCFIQQMPPGLRPSLYVRDDDYRYSFLFGNFITLTNLDEEDWTRMNEQRLSPLYVSVHATDAQLRARILGVTEVVDILAQIKRIANMGIDVHTQIVVIPGLNDGVALARTVHDLANLYPTVNSIAVVPVGLTRYHTCNLRTLTAIEARDVLEFIQLHQRMYRQEYGVGLVYAADELYLMGDQPIPTARSYDGFPQIANGVGLTRQLLDDWRRTKRRGLRVPWKYKKATMVCGTLIAPTLQILAMEMAKWVGANIEVVPVPNEFFGPTVTVSGLLMARDVVNVLHGRDLGELVILPRAMFDASGELTLDDYKRTDIEEQLGVRVAVADRLREVVGILGR